jgi:hypothetical protein
MMSSVKTMLLLLLLLVLVFASLAWAEPPPPSSPDGYVIDESSCGSGGPKVYFFAAGKVLVEDCGDDCPLISEGTWKIEKGVISLTLTTLYLGKGEDLLGNAASAVYHRYRAEVRSGTGTPTRTWTWTGRSEEDSCSRVRRHELHDSSARGLLKHEFKGDYPFLSERELTAADLKGKSKEELSRMRNELFAAYGYIFKNEALAKHFSSKPGYESRFIDVTAFLSPLERRNLVALQRAEKR